jgi:SAM-dependent methyltransferase
MQIRDLFAMRAHFGWVHVLLGRLHRSAGHNAVGKAIGRVMDRMEKRTHRQSAKFDADHGTVTFRRLDVRISDDPNDTTVWGYAAINRDFFAEILRSIPRPLAPYSFVDVGSGMGAAVFFASDFPFRRLVGVELTPELVDIARRNTELFNQKAGKSIEPEWVLCDFFKWDIPNEPQLFFFNNPFPESITVAAIQALEQSLKAHPRPALLVFRKAPPSTGAYLHRSSAWAPLRLAPYWRIYASTGDV